MLVTADAGEVWSRLESPVSDVIALAVAPA
jgi:hypothetical protein